MHSVDEPDEKPKFDWQGLLLVIVIPAFALSIILLSPVIAVYFLIRKLKYMGKPPECCTSGCSTCPWGDLKYRKYRKAYKEWRSPNGSNRRPRVFEGKQELFGKPPLTTGWIKCEPNQSPTSESDW
jgi:hypothetical protein